MDAHSSSKTSRLLALALVVAGLVTVKASGVGYLAKIGPTPLRFRPAPAPKALVSLPLLDKSQSPLATDATPTPNPPVQPAATPTPDNFGIPDSDSNIDSLPDTSNMESMLPQPIARSSDTQIAAPAANEMLVVTPQMLIDYFKPMAGATNGAGVSVLMPVHFTPPIPSAPPSSRATYKTQ